MTKNLKLSIKNTQIAGAINLGGLKEKKKKKKDAADEVPLEEKPVADKAVKAKKKTPAVAEVTKPSTKSAKSDKTDSESLPEKVEVAQDSEKKQLEKKRARTPILKTKEREHPHKEELPEPVKEKENSTSEKSQVIASNIVEIAVPPVVTTTPAVAKIEKPAPITAATPTTRISSKPIETRDRQELRSSYQKRGESQSSAHFRPKPMESKPYQERRESSVSSSDTSKQFVRPLPGGDRAFGAPQPMPGYQENEKIRQQQREGASQQQSFDEQQGNRAQDRFPPRRDLSGYPPREGSGSGYPPRREGSGGGYPPRRDTGGYPSSRREEGSGGYPPRRDGSSSYPPRRDNSGAGGGYPPRRDGSGTGYPPRREGPGGGYPPRREGSGPSRYPPRREGSAGGYPPRREGGGYPPREGFGAPRPFSPRPVIPPKGFGQKEEFLIDEQRRSRSDFEEAAKKFPKGKLKEPIVPKSTRKGEEKAFDARARHGFISDDEETGNWRSKRRPKASQHHAAQQEARPSKIKVRLPVVLKDLAAEMKLKASELISKLFLQGIVLTLNDILDDSTVVELLGHEFGCEIVIDTSEESRIRISDHKVAEEIQGEESANLMTRPPVVAFMGHVDHGKTSLIDAIRKSNRAAKEVGAITQHIGAFKCQTAHGYITILDTPGHEAFTLMRERGAEVTDIVVLVVAGDEGIQEQTIEAIKQAQNAKATIVVALTKCDKPNFDAERVYRQLADQELLPEVWGGQTITLNCSAVTQKGIPELLEMLALQAEILELKANPARRARGMVIESQMQQGLGAVATVLVQNGTLRLGDALVFGVKWAKVKTMRDEHGLELTAAEPSTPVQITGLSGLPEAGEEFIVVKNEKEAREIAEARQEGRRQSTFQLKKRSSLESMMESASHGVKQKVLNLVLRADVQGSLEALVKALEKAKSDKVEVNVISQGVGQISESDAHLAAVSGAIILGFHTSVETHAEPLIKEMGVKVLLNDIIYHAVDAVREQMKSLLDKLAQEVEKGNAEVKATFKSSQLGIIAGCQVIDGVIARSHQIRVKRDGEIVWKGSISSLKRVKDDVKEVQKGVECGICLSGYNDVRVGDILQAYDVIYVAQEL